MVVKTLFLALILLAAGVILMAVKVLFVRNGTFPSGHVHNLPGFEKSRTNKKN